MSFLPTDYKSPNSSNSYLKLQEGENRIRIMSRPIMGWEDWDLNNKPIRFRMHERPAKPIVSEKPIRHFWSLIVFNYTEERVQIMHIVQNTIRKSIEALCRDTDWGDPFGYDIKIVKEGKGKDTDYSVNPVPHKPMDAYLVNEFKSNPCNLEAIFLNADPFSSEWDSYTPMGNETQTQPSTVNTVNFTMPLRRHITEQQAQQLELLIQKCDPEKEESIREFLSKVCENSRDLSKMDASMHPKMLELIEGRAAQYQKTIKANEVPF